MSAGSRLLLGIALVGTGVLAAMWSVAGEAERTVRATPAAAQDADRADRKASTQRASRPVQQDERGLEQSDSTRRPVPEAEEPAPFPPVFPMRIETRADAEPPIPLVTAQVLVKDASGAPIPAARVTLNATGHASREGVTDAAGRVSFDGLLARTPRLGRTTLRATVLAERFARHSVSRQIREDESWVSVHAVLSELGGAIQGTVLDPESNPLPRAMVRIRADPEPEEGAARPVPISLERRRTDAAGHFVFEGLGEGSYQLLVNHPADSHWTAQTLARPGGDEVELRFDPWSDDVAWLDFRLVHDRSGLPVPNAKVEIERQTRTWAAGRVSKLIDVREETTCAAPADTPIHIRVKAAGFLPYSETHRVFPPGRYVLPIALRPSGDSP